MIRIYDTSSAGYEEILKGDMRLRMKGSAKPSAQSLMTFEKITTTRYSNTPKNLTALSGTA